MGDVEEANNNGNQLMARAREFNQVGCQPSEKETDRQRQTNRDRQKQ